MHRILIVDDERPVVDNLEVIIPWEELGIGEVHKAYSGEEAIAFLGKRAVDVVLTDIRMPGMDGLELVEFVRRTSKHTKCILLTGHAEFDFAQKALRAQADDYLLKPVGDDELMDAVRKALEQLRGEWEVLHSRQRVERIAMENLPALRRDMLKDLLGGKTMPEEALDEKLGTYDIPIARGDDASLLLIRPDEGFGQYDRYRLGLIEFAVGNIAEEIVGRSFLMWQGRNVHGDLAFVVKPKRGAPGEVTSEEPAADPLKTLERLAEQLQYGVETYLKGHISVIVSRPERFPDQLAPMHRSCLASLRNKVAGENGLFVTAASPEEETADHRALKSLHEPPTLIGLVEAGRIDDAWTKLRAVFRELADAKADFRELGMETYHSLCAAFSYFARQNGKPLSDIVEPDDYEAFAGPARFRTAEGMQDWAFRVMERLADSAVRDITDSRARIVRQVNQYIERHLAEGISVPAIADQVYMHPAYLSRVYKLETGESISDYVYRIRMERALHLLKRTDAKIYEIAAKLGYQNDSYFIKVFRKHFGLTPQECRDR